MEAPNAIELLKNLLVQESLQQAWIDSLADDPKSRHEEGGWIFLNPMTEALDVRRAAPGQTAAIDLCDPPLVDGSMVVATFHTHPNPSKEGWEPGPSPGDTQSAFILGVPCLIRADNGIHTTGPVRRRGGMMGNAGFPAEEETPP